MLLDMRRQMFYIIDKYFRKGVISNHLEDLKQFDNLKADRFLLEQDSRLKEITEYASKNCEFYKDFHHFTEFPVINKQIVKSQEENFRSKKYPLNKLFPVTTSGSTGIPFKVYQDEIKIKRNTADTIHFAEIANYHIGEPLYYLRVWNKINISTSIKHKIQNVYPVNVFDMSSQGLERIINVWNKTKSSIGILGYASAILEIALFLSKNKNLKKFKVHSIVTMSESLEDESKKFISQIFDCKVYARYSNIENGIIAQNFNDSNLFRINSASYKVEILNMDNDILEEEGKIGRIVVTDYFNFGMPLIRYDTGDIGSMRKIMKNGQIMEVLACVEGRRMDAIYDTQGKLLSSFIITNGMWNYIEINQYQFIQIAEKHYLFKISIDKKFKREKELIKQYKRYLGQDAEINIEYVNEIPLLSSAKRKKVTNLMPTKPV